MARDIAPPTNNCDTAKIILSKRLSFSALEIDKKHYRTDEEKKDYQPKKKIDRASCQDIFQSHIYSPLTMAVSFFMSSRPTENPSAGEGGVLTSWTILNGKRRVPSGLDQTPLIRPSGKIVPL